MAGLELPIRAIREQISSAVDVIVQLERMRDGKRCVTEISEVLDLEGDTITMSSIYRFNHRAGVDGQGNPIGRLEATGIRPRFSDDLAAMGYVLNEGLLRNDTPDPFNTGSYR